MLIDGAALSDAVAASTSRAAVLRALGLPETGGNRARLERALAHHGISTAHFTGQGHRRGRPSPQRLTADEILRRRPTGARRRRRAQLDRALREKGVPYRCAGCGTTDRWQGRTLVLEIDHVNGDPLDDRLENLRYLCPSCHSQTPSHSRRRTRQVK
jgi:5-methylcytosine-specific restriction endonuclease McrA